MTYTWNWCYYIRFILILYKLILLIINLRVKGSQVVFTHHWIMTSKPLAFVANMVRLPQSLVWVWESTLKVLSTWYLSLETLRGTCLSSWIKIWYSIGFWGDKGIATTHYEIIISLTRVVIELAYLLLLLLSKVKRMRLKMTNAS